MTSTTAAKEIQLIAIGNGVGIELTADLLAKIGVENGDTVSVQATSTGIQITPSAMSIARRIMREDKDVLRRLAE